MINIKIKSPLGIAPIDRFTEHLALIASKQEGKRFLDMGCGTGYIAIYLAKKGFDVDAVDISPEAVEVTKENAVINDVQIKSYVSNLFNNIKGKFDVIIFNPPVGNNKGRRFGAWVRSLIRKTPLMKIAEPLAYNFYKGDRYKIVKQFIEEGVNHLTEKGVFLILSHKSELKSLINLFNNFKLEVIKDKEIFPPLCIIKAQKND